MDKQIILKELDEEQKKSIIRVDDILDTIADLFTPADFEQLFSKFEEAIEGEEEAVDNTFLQAACDSDDINLFFADLSMFLWILKDILPIEREI